MVSNSNNRTRKKAIQFRVTEEEYNQIEEKANLLGVTLSNYVRLVALHSDIKVFINLDNVEIDISED